MGTEMLTVGELVAALNAMTTHGIATLFEKEEIKALRSNSQECAVARYLKKHTGHVVRVGGNVIYDQTANSYHPVSSKLAHFILLFDMGHFPELDFWAAGQKLPKAMARAIQQAAEAEEFIIPASMVMKMKMDLSELKNKFAASLVPGPEKAAADLGTQAEYSKVA